MSHQKEQELVSLTSSADLQEEQALEDTADQKSSEPEKIAPVDPSPLQMSPPLLKKQEKKRRETTYQQLLEPLAFTSYSSPVTANFSFLEALQECWEAFENLNFLNTGTQFTLQENIILEQAVAKVVGAMAKLLHEHKFFPDYTAEAVYSANSLLAIIEDMLKLKKPELELCSVQIRLKELVELMQSQISVSSMLTSLIEDAKSLTQAIRAYMEKPADGKSLKTTEGSKQIIQAYGELLIKCRINGFLLNDIFFSIDLSNNKQRDIIEDALLDEIIHLVDNNPKYKDQINEAGVAIGEVQTEFCKLIKTIPSVASINHWSQDLKSTSSSTEPKYPLLQAMLKYHYLQQDTVPLPCSGSRFPIEDCQFRFSFKDKNKTPVIEKSPSLEEKKFGEKKVERVEEQSEVKDQKLSHASSEKEPMLKLSRRTLLEGRAAGSGNTTLCQFFARQWAQEIDEQSAHAWQAQQFHYLFIVSLPDLLADGNSCGNMPSRVAAYIYKQFNHDLQSQTSLREIAAVLSHEQNSRTLLFLDGFDKVARFLADHKSAHYKILHELMGFRNVFVTTRNYVIPPAQYPFDSCKVSSKLNETEVNAYIQGYCKFALEDKEKKRHDLAPDAQTVSQQAFALRGELARNDCFMELTQTPLFLATICEDYLPASVVSSSVGGKATDKDYKVAKTATCDLPKLNLGEIHHHIVTQILERHMQAYRPAATSAPEQSPHEFYAARLMLLGEMAWRMYESQKSIVAGSILREHIGGMKDFPHIYQPMHQRIEQEFAESLALGFLQYHPDDETKPLLERNYFFITSGFEKYFAALYLLPLLTHQHKEQVKSMSNWLGKNKYHPQHAVFLEFCAGLAAQPGYDFALSSFWEALQLPPRDVVGKRHAHLIAKCLIASWFDPRIPGREQLLASIRQWIDSMLLKDNLENTAWLEDLLHDKPGLVRACGWQLSTNWIKAAKHEDKNIQLRTLIALGRFGVNLVSYPLGLELFFSAVRMHGSDELNIGSVVKKAMASLTVNFAAYPDSFKQIHVARYYTTTDALTAVCFALRASVVAGYRPAIEIVFKILKFEASSGRYLSHPVMMAALSVLSELREKRATIPDLTDVMSEVAMSRKFSAQIRIAAFSTFCPLTASPTALAGVLQFTNPMGDLNTIETAIQALVPSIAASQEVQEAIFQLAINSRPAVRGAALCALGQLPDNLIYQEKYLAGILAMSAPLARIVEVSPRLAKNLGSYPQALSLICKAAEQGNRLAIYILKHANPCDEVVKAFCQVAKKEDSVARKMVLSKLGEWLPLFRLYKKDLYKECLGCLLLAAKDKDPEVRENAIAAFSGSKQISYRPIFEAVCKAATDEKNIVRVAAVNILTELHLQVLEQPTYNILFNALEHKKALIQKATVIALRKIGEEVLTHPRAEKFLDNLKARAENHKDCAHKEALATLSAMKQHLARRPDILALVLSDQEARDLLDTHTLIQIYLELERTKEKTKSFWSFSSSPNPCLPVLVARVQQEDLAIVLDYNSLTLVAGGQQSRFYLGNDIESAHALSTAIRQTREKCEQPAVTFKFCTKMDNIYPATASAKAQAPLLNAHGFKVDKKQVRSTSVSTSTSTSISTTTPSHTSMTPIVPRKK
ncbi:MAG TPA: NACHT domain-containing protein [Gammaproteobacteria bacterium]|nr:NACHT domain-containing protein [Gammaproteobacteria bacterium]